MRFSQLLLAAIAVLPCAASSALADRIVLRDLQVISNKTVVGFDEDGVRLDDKSLISWDKIEAGKIDANKQAAFDKMLKELGAPLFRIGQRLSVGDYLGLVSHAQAVYPRYRGRTSETAYMVVQAVMWGRLAEGRAEEALAPYLYCYHCLRAMGVVDPNLPGPRRLEFSPRTGLSSELPPVWFNAKAAKQELPQVLAAILAIPRSRRPVAARIYYASMAIAAGEHQTADKYLTGLESPPLARQMKLVLKAQQEVAAKKPGAAVDDLDQSLRHFPSEARPLALFWLGRAKTLSSDADERKTGALQLLRLPAMYAKEQPRLAAAALFFAFEVLRQAGDKVGAELIRQELLQKYGKTYYAMQLHQQAANLSRTR